MDEKVTQVNPYLVGAEIYYTNPAENKTWPEDLTDKFFLIVALDEKSLKDAALKSVMTIGPAAAAPVVAYEVGKVVIDIAKDMLMDAIKDGIKDYLGKDGKVEGPSGPKATAIGGNVITTETCKFNLFCAVTFAPPPPSGPAAAPAETPTGTPTGTPAAGAAAAPGAVVAPGGEAAGAVVEPSGEVKAGAAAATAGDTAKASGAAKEGDLQAIIPAEPLKFRQPGQEMYAAQLDKRIRALNSVLSKTWNSLETFARELEEVAEEADIPLTTISTGDTLRTKDEISTDPLNIAGWLRDLGFEDKELIERTVSEANSAITEIESFIQTATSAAGGLDYTVPDNPLPDLLSELASNVPAKFTLSRALTFSGSADSASTDTRDINPLDTDEKDKNSEGQRAVSKLSGVGSCLSFETALPVGVTIRSDFLATQDENAENPVTGDIMQPGFYPEPFHSVFDEDTWQLEA